MHKFLDSPLFGTSRRKPISRSHSLPTEKAGNLPHSIQRASRHQVMQHNEPSNRGVLRPELDESYPSPFGGFVPPAPSPPRIYTDVLRSFFLPDSHPTLITPEPAGEMVATFSAPSFTSTSTVNQATYTARGNTQNQNLNPNQASSSKVHQAMSAGSPLTSTPTQQTMRPPTHPRRQSQTRLSIGLVEKLPSEKRESLTSSRNATPSPSSPPFPSMYSNRALRDIPPSMQTQTTFELKTTDYGYGVGDLRREFVKKIDLERVPEPPAPASGGSRPPLDKGKIAKFNSRLQTFLPDPRKYNASPGGQLPVVQGSGSQTAPTPPQRTLASSPLISLKPTQKKPLRAVRAVVSTFDSRQDLQNYFDERLHNPNEVVSSIPHDLCSKVDYACLPEDARLGSGSGGSVYRVHHEDLGIVAIKHLRVVGSGALTKVMKDACREANQWRTAASHPNILQLLGMIRARDNLFLVCPYVRRGSLRQYILQNAQADHMRVKLLTDVAAALVHLQQLGIIHGDIKALNVLVSDEESALLCDFGLSRNEECVTSTGQKNVGTLRWKSPELFDGEGRSFASDIWAFGMTIYEVLSGYIPYHEKRTDTAVTMAIAIKKILPAQEPKLSPGGYSYEPAWDCASLCWKYAIEKRGTAEQIHRILQES